MGVLDSIMSQGWKMPPRVPRATQAVQLVLHSLVWCRLLLTVYWLECGGEGRATVLPFRLPILPCPTSGHHESEGELGRSSLSAPPLCTCAVILSGPPVAQADGESFIHPPPGQLCKDHFESGPINSGLHPICFKLLSN